MQKMTLNECVNNTASPSIYTSDFLITNQPLEKNTPGETGVFYRVRTKKESHCMEKSCRFRPGGRNAAGRIIGYGSTFQTYMASKTSEI